MMRDYLTEHGTDADVSECLGEIFDSIGESDAAEGEKAYFKAAAALGIDRPVTRKRHRAVSWFAGIAAALAVLIAGGATALLVDGSRDVEWNEIKVPAGQTRELVLADGTVLHLNAGSRVTYPVSFKGWCAGGYRLPSQAAKCAKRPFLPFPSCRCRTSLQIPKKLPWFDFQGSFFAL